MSLVTSSNTAGYFLFETVISMETLFEDTLKIKRNISSMDDTETLQLSKICVKSLCVTEIAVVLRDECKVPFSNRENSNYRSINWISN